MSFPCGMPVQCQCNASVPTNFKISCVGNRINRFPQFSLYESMSCAVILISATAINTLPDLSEWRSLRTVILENNAYLPCTDVYEFSIMHPNITVISDCITGSTSSTTPQIKENATEGTTVATYATDMPILGIETTENEHGIGNGETSVGSTTEIT